MSVTAHWAGLTTAPTTGSSRAPAHRAASVERPVVRMVTFAALALFGIERWATLTTAPPTGRLIGLVAVVVALGAIGPWLQTRRRGLAIAAAALGVLAAFPLSGVPLAWLAHMRIAVTADAIGRGLGGLSEILVPYSGANPWVSMVITMGAAVLLVDAGVLLALSPASLGDGRRAGVALPLIALAVVPSTLLRPNLPYLQGVLLFGLLAAFLWGERVRRRELAAVVGVCAVAAVAALAAAPSIDQHRPWIDVRTWAGGFAPAHLERFDWSQTYGPLNWPQTGHNVLEVQAAHADYWKAENLDSFDGRAWTAGVGAARPTVDPLLGVSSSVRARWTQSIHITLDAMTTPLVIAAGSAAAPDRLAGRVIPGASPGTWIAAAPLRPGDSYLVTAYTPRPTAAALEDAGTRYPDRALAVYRSLQVPYELVPGSTVPVEFPPFHSGLDVRAPDGAATVTGSPYGRAYALATRLASGSRTPYAFVLAVERYLGDGYTYNQNPPVRRYPLESFLFNDREGYCQQFAGAMALLLRMGGIPARVAAGFTTGAYDSSAHRWVVSDVDAHAWVEAWFPHYGWVRFDPTPATAPARGGASPISGFVGSAASSQALAPTLARQAAAQPAASSAGRKRSGDLPVFVLVIAAVVGVGLLGSAALVTRRRRHPPAAGDLLGELERALARTGRPLAAGTTLAGLEERLRPSPGAAAYVRAIRMARFGGGAAPPSGEQRRALRSQLSAGLGFGGAVRALWALPPGWPRPSRLPTSDERPARGAKAGAYTHSHG